MFFLSIKDGSGKGTWIYLASNTKLDHDITLNAQFTLSSQSSALIIILNFYMNKLKG